MTEMMMMEMMMMEMMMTETMMTEMMMIIPGTGAISIALLTHWKKLSVTCLAIELCDHAVALTRENSRLHGLQDLLEVQHQDFRQWLQSSLPLSSEQKFDLIVSNPPYIPSDDMLLLEPEVCEYEDRAALHGGEDGMDLILCILRAGGRRGGEDGEGRAGEEARGVEHRACAVLMIFVQLTSSAPAILKQGSSIWLEGDEDDEEKRAEGGRRADLSRLDGQYSGREAS
eukprot:764306-Hanusia_phi.AAC.5